MAMRKLVFAGVPAALLCLSALGANVHPELAEVKRVYLLSMTSGLDQYLANRLTQVGRFEVVTDPANADAVFTDRLGPAFEDKRKELYPPPPAPEVAEKDADEEKDSDKKKRASKIEDFAAAPISRISSFSSGKGNVFLVSRKTGAVLWSHYKQPKTTRSKDMDNTADDIIDGLHDAVKVKK
jgi:hypothetical protein